jgi:outer membrane lipoprotein LolB
MRCPVLIPAILTVAAGLGGCASTGTRELPNIDNWEARKGVLEKTDEWDFAGRIGVSAGSEGFNGKLWWRQDGIVYRARISGPIGIGTIFINGDGPEVTLTESNGTVTELIDAESELRSRYGWTIPVNSLRYWTLGIPDPSSPSEVRFNESGQMAELSQRDWQVSIGQYGQGGGQAMPRRLTAVSDDIRVRLVIDSWTFR